LLFWRLGQVVWVLLGGFVMSRDELLAAVVRLQGLLSGAFEEYGERVWKGRDAGRMADVIRELEADLEALYLELDEVL
jgi:hypothetical protein